MDRGLQSFNDWMNSGASWSLLVAILLAPVFVLIHEVGHATVGLIQTEGLVAVRVGRVPARWQARVGRLRLEINPLPARNMPAGLAMVYARCGVGTRVMLGLAGPFAQAVAAALVMIVGARMNVAGLEVVGGLGIIDALLNLVPREWRGFRSDGAYILDALRHAGVASRDALDGSTAEPFKRALADTYSRWFVLFTDSKAQVRTPRRAQLLGGAPVALGHRLDDRSAVALGLWRLAFAGWCWREVERGEPDRVREAALDAVHVATLTGALEPDLTARAARNLATGSTELGLASPGADDAERARFLAAAFMQMPADLRIPVIPEAQQRFAFGYGVALRDIERARV
jgi:hypothetical protein